MRGIKVCANARQGYTIRPGVKEGVSSTGESTGESDACGCSFQVYLVNPSRRARGRRVINEMTCRAENQEVQVNGTSGG